MCLPLDVYADKTPEIQPSYYFSFSKYTIHARDVDVHFDKLCGK